MNAKWVVHEGWLVPVREVSLLSLCCFYLFFPWRRVGTLNINGGRDSNRRAILEMRRAKHIDVLMLQETHSSGDNVTDCAMSWKGQFCLSHKIRLFGKINSTLKQLNSSSVVVLGGAGIVPFNQPATGMSCECHQPPPCPR